MARCNPRKERHKQRNVEMKLSHNEIKINSEYSDEVSRQSTEDSKNVVKVAFVEI